MIDEEVVLVRQRAEGSRAISAADRLAGALHRVASGDWIAFEEVYRLSSTKLFGVCLRIVSDQQGAEDVLQDVYCAVWRGAGGFNPLRGTAMTWLITIARNRSVDQLRRCGRAATVSIEQADDVPDPQPSAFELAAASLRNQRMTQCLERLAKRDVDVLRAAFFHGSTYTDLATAAGIPIGTMKSRVRRALIRIREDMAEVERPDTSRARRHREGR